MAIMIVFRQHMPLCTLTREDRMLEIMVMCIQKLTTYSKIF